MSDESQQNVVVHLSGQDDNLGDSVLRDGLLRALQGKNRSFHIYVMDHRGFDQSSDYMTGLNLCPRSTVHKSRRLWLEAGSSRPNSVHVFNAGEINPQRSHYPPDSRVRELARAKSQGAAVIIAGVGLKNPHEAANVKFAPEFKEADIMSWRDHGSCIAAGFGEVNPDWAYSLGTSTDAWKPAGQRRYLAVTLRFDRPYPGSAWIGEVKKIAAMTETKIVTIAQVSRDAPRAVQLASDLGGHYFGAPSFSHAQLDVHVRDVLSKSLAVISDRAHGLIIGATEGAYPIGSGSDPQKISRLLSTVGLGDLVGSYDKIENFGSSLSDHLSDLAPAIDSARQQLARLTVKMQALMGSV